MHSGLDRLRTPESCLIEPNKPRVPAMEPPRMSSIRRNCRTSGAKKWMCLGILVSKRDLNPRRDTSTPLAWNRYQSASIGSWIINFLSRAGQPAEACGRCLPLLKLRFRVAWTAKRNKTSPIRINERHRRQEAHVEDHANPATMPGPSQSYSIWEKFAHPWCYRRAVRKQKREN